MTTAIMKNQPVNIRYDSFFTRALTLLRQADIRNPLRYLLITHCLLLCAIEAGDLLDSVKTDICKQSRQQGGFHYLLINASAPSAARSSRPTKSIKSPDVPRYCSPGR